jgi:methyl-accepting chemotaxis protein
MSTPMAEYKPQTKYVPLRVRFSRPLGEATNGEREPFHVVREEYQGVAEPLVPDMSDFSEAQRQTQQIKELVRLSTLLRADLSLDMILQQFAASIAACTGYQVLVINLFDMQNNVIRAAFAGLSEADQKRLRARPRSLESVSRVLLPQFRISQSYFIPHESRDSSQAVPCVAKDIVYEDYELGGWHPEDSLYVPFYSPRQQKMLGFLSLDNPENGKRPTEESIEVAELFANQVAIAVDNARLIQEREEEHRALEQGIGLLKEELESLRGEPLRPLKRAAHPSLQPVVDSINLLGKDVKAMMGSAKQVIGAVDEHAHSVQRSSELLTRDAEQREHQVEKVARTLAIVSGKIQLIIGHIEKLSVKTGEAMEVTKSAQDAVDRTYEGLQGVREATMRSARSMKALGENSQEIIASVGEITDLSMRLHLLALNAAIEASRVGEYGHGFAVVVREIRAMAQSCGQAARKVSDYIIAHQRETASVSHSVEQSTQQVVIQTELVMQAGAALDAVNQVTDELTGIVKEICATVDGQGQTSQQVERAVSEIARVADVITFQTHSIQRSLDHLADLTDILRMRIAFCGSEELVSQQM